jgi:hypothetical protein
MFFVVALLLKYELGIGLLFDPLEALLSRPGRWHVFNLVSPVVFLGGLILALGLNAQAILRLNVGGEERAIVGAVRLEVRLSGTSRWPSRASCCLRRSLATS